MRAQTNQGIYSWLGIFAIAMLFIGPPIGQWRAALHSAAAAQAHAAHAAHATHHDAHAGHHSAHNDAAVSLDAQDSATRQVGVLTLDHCGYCHLVACFAALPGTSLSTASARWPLSLAVIDAYPTPRQVTLYIQRARAPPLPA